MYDAGDEAAEKMMDTMGDLMKDILSRSGARSSRRLGGSRVKYVDRTRSESAEPIGHRLSRMVSEALSGGGQAGASSWAAAEDMVLIADTDEKADHLRSVLERAGVEFVESRTEATSERLGLPDGFLPEPIPVTHFTVRGVPEGDFAFLPSPFGGAGGILYGNLPLADASPASRAEMEKHSLEAFRASLGAPQPVGERPVAGASFSPGAEGNLHLDLNAAWASGAKARFDSLMEGSGVPYSCRQMPWDVARYEFSPAHAPNVMDVVEHALTLRGPEGDRAVLANLPDLVERVREAFGPEGDRAVLAAQLVPFSLEAYRCAAAVSALAPEAVGVPAGEVAPVEFVPGREGNAHLDFTTVSWDPQARIILDPLEKAGVPHSASPIGEGGVRIEFDPAHARNVLAVAEFHLGNKASRIHEGRFPNLDAVRTAASAPPEATKTADRGLERGASTRDLPRTGEVVEVVVEDAEVARALEVALFQSGVSYSSSLSAETGQTVFSLWAEEVRGRASAIEETAARCADRSAAAEIAPALEAFDRSRRNAVAAASEPDPSDARIRPPQAAESRVRTPSMDQERHSRAAEALAQDRERERVRTRSMGGK